MSLVAKCQNYKFDVKQLEVKDGLANRHIWSTHIDKSGFLWIGLNNEIQRFDGHEFKTFKLPDWIWTVNKIIQSKDGDLILINTTEKQVLFINPISGKMSSLSEKWGDSIASEIKAIHENANQILWENNFIVSKTNNSIKLIDWNNGNIVSSKHFFGKNDLSNSTISSVDSSEQIWILNGNKISMLNVALENIGNYEVNYFDPQNDQFSFYHWDEKYWALVRSNLISKNDRLLLFGENGKLSEVFECVEGQHIQDFRNGWIWVRENSDWKIFDLKGELVTNLNIGNENKSLFSSVERMAKIDHFNNNFYIKSPFGLTILKININNFKTYFTNSNNENLPFSSSARDIFVEKESIYAVFECGGLVKFKKGDHNNTFQVLMRHDKHPLTLDQGLFCGRIIFKDSKNRFWSDLRSNIYLMDKDFKNIMEISFDENPPNYYDEIWSIYEDNNGSIWINYPNMIRKVSSDGSNIEYLSYPSMGFNEANVNIYQVFKSSEHEVWMCTSAGLYLFDTRLRKVVARYIEGAKEEFKIPVSNVYHLHIDKEGLFWIGSDNGLLRWDSVNNELRLFNQDDGLSDNTIYAIYSDSTNTLWLSSDYGIMSFDKNEFEVKTFLPKDGTAQEEFNRISHFQDENGTIYFGGLNGITTFDPYDFSKNQLNEINVEISDFEIFDGEKGTVVNKYNEVFTQRVINFKPKDRFFKLKFSLPSFLNIDQVKYAWRLKGIDSTWNIQKENSIQIGLLPYGSHLLQVKGNDGTGWSEEVLELKIHVLRPFYLQFWFIISSIALLIFGIYYIFNRRTYQLKKMKILLEKEVDKATKEIKENKDIIERQADDLRKMDQLKSRFFANVSHELRTPLTLMMGPISSVLKSGKLDNRNFTLLKQAQLGGKDLLHLVSSILGLSKLEANKMEVHEKPELLYDVVRDIISSFESYALQKDIHFVFQFHANRDLYILIDREKVQTIFKNLISNAIKYSTQESAITIEIWDEVNHLKCMVKDSGRGIHHEDIPNIFNRFYQTAQSDSAIEGGVGIGLAFVKELVELMQGKIWVESKLDEGSSFYFTLPKKEVFGQLDLKNKIQTEPVSKMHALENIGTDSTVEKNSALYKILVVEDNHSLRIYLHTILSQYYEVYTVENGKEGLEFLDAVGSAKSEDQVSSDRYPNLIISDIMMPIMDGYQFLNHLKSNEVLRQIPVVMLTARANIQDKLTALKLGVDDYLIKPFNEDELLIRIENLLDNYSERQNNIKDSNAPLDTSKVNDVPKTFVASKADEDWLKQVEETLSHQIGNSQYSILQLANDLSISERHLRRKLKILVGTTPTKYFTLLRLQQARQFLENKTYTSIVQIAKAVGFQSPKAFSRAFAKEFGKPPSSYYSN